MISPSAMAGMYSPSTSFQSLLANISAVPRPPPQVQSPKQLVVPDNVISSPPTSPTVGLSLVTGGVVSPSSHQAQQPSPPHGPQRSDTPPEDRRSSSIAALRLKAREHEMKLEMLRQNGHAHTDILS